MIQCSLYIWKNIGVILKKLLETESARLKNVRLGFTMEIFALVEKYLAKIFDA